MASEEKVKLAPPAPTLYERYVTADTSQVTAFDDNWLAQTFTIGNTGANEDHYVASVELKLNRIGLPGTVTVSIRAVDGDGKPTGGDLASGTTDGDTLTTATDGEWREVALTSYILSESTQYAIVIRALSGDSSNRVNWKFDGSFPTYTGGIRVYSANDGSSWSLASGDDLIFREYGTAIAPEICSWIEAKGGPSALSIVDIFVIIDSYLFGTPPSGYTFVPTLQNVFGVIDYYLGFNGDAATGCNFFP